jgi:hypothetical protein
MSRPLNEQAIEKAIEEKIRTVKFKLKNEPQLYYTPIGKGEQFIDLASSGNYRTILLEAANGIGKTMLSINFLCHLFWKTDNPYFGGKLFKDWPYPKHGRVISDPNTVTETIIPMMKEIFPAGRYNNERFSTTKEGKRFEAHWVTDTGWDFTIMTYEQDVKEFESANLGFILMDEPPPEPIYKANYARLRGQGIIILTETPLSGSQWIYDQFIELPPDKLEAQKKAVVHAELEDACEEHGVRGFIKHERIMDMVSQYDEDDMMARVYGKHAHLSGLIFKKWTPQVHVIKPFKLEDRDWLVVHALDPHPRVSDAGLWVAFGRDHRIIVCDELWGDWDTNELAIRIKGIDKFYRRKGWLLDPSAYVVDKHTGDSLAADLSALGLRYTPGSKARTEAIRVIKDKLNYQIANGVFVVKPTIYVFDTCPQTIWELSHWQWENWQGKTAAYKTLKERPEDKNDHMIENLGRILLSGIEFESIIENDERDLQRQTPVIIDPYS